MNWRWLTAGEKLRVCLDSPQGCLEAERQESLTSGLQLPWNSCATYTIH